ncbi:MAG: ATP-binding cassette domain-containing protein [Bacteriovoracaceae bacterium]|nr:ATP-binding cassette domain-containing protein [Bacteriovoracaceae bacterium]
MSEYLLEVNNLTKRFPIHGGILGREVAAVSAVNNVSFKIKKGETLGIVGESGCGKTTLGRTLLRLIEPTSGQVIFDGTDVTKLDDKGLKNMRRRMQIIFQDPFASLNPRMTVGRILSEPMNVHGLYMGKEERVKRLHQLLGYVQLPIDTLNKYPHEFSGGQRQRVCIARALAVEPDFIVCDEPVSALDVSVQAQVVNLLMDLQVELGLTFLFIAHDLKVVEYISSKVGVMYLGNMIEHATAEEIYGDMKHPYTKALFSAIPEPDPKKRSKRILLEGDIPSPMDPPPGCHFSPRCWKATDQCRSSYPAVEEKSDTHFFRCHNPI